MTDNNHLPITTASAPTAPEPEKSPAAPQSVPLPAQPIKVVAPATPDTKA